MGTKNKQYVLGLMMSDSENKSLEGKKQRNMDQTLRLICVSTCIVIFLGCYIVYETQRSLTTISLNAFKDPMLLPDVKMPEALSRSKTKEYILTHRLFLNETIHMMLKKKNSDVKQFDIKYPHSCKIWRHYEKSKIDQSILIYSKYQKSGSTTITHLLYNITLKNGVNFRYTLSKDALGYNGITGLHNLTEIIKGYPKPVIYIAHVGFLDFTKIGYNPPVYIDVVRDPVEQAISMFYFLKQCWACQRKHNNTYRESIIKMNMSDYIDKYGVDKLPRKSQIKWFSGIDGNRKSINMAKRNIEKYYLLIGVQEYYIQTMQALEMLLPLFKGQLHSKVQAGVRIGATTHSKFPPNSHQFQLMREKYAFDYDLYNFIVQRFHGTLKCLHIP
ncbi:unnamed protein product [Owenia fusiformis]|uniref:Uncharacterized protein n=1 Tax=Owenia fusiformis TaxID=6347 RepID=A0A8J1UNA4_OWEFU|nr:unnamed protein product [Owenia fusiformis]